MGQTGAPTSNSTGPIAEVSSFPSHYPHFVQCTKDFTLEWSLVANNSIAFRLRSNFRGWVGIGFGSSDGKMTNCDMIITTLRKTVVVVRDFWSPGFIQPLLDTSLNGKNDIYQYRGNVTDNVTEVEFVRTLAAGDQDVDREIPLGPTTIVYAYGSTEYLAMHNDSGSVTVNILTGEVLSMAKEVGVLIRTIHAALMAFSWGFFWIAGAIVFRYGRGWLSGETCGRPSWFVTSYVLQGISFFLAAIGVALALIASNGEFRTVYHSKMGAGVMCGGLLQMIIALFRPKDFIGTTGKKRKPAHIVFEYINIILSLLLFVGSTISITSGLITFDLANSAYLYSYVSYLSAVVLFVLLAEFRNRKNVAAELRWHKEVQQPKPAANKPKVEHIVAQRTPTTKKDRPKSQLIEESEVIQNQFGLNNVVTESPAGGGMRKRSPKSTIPKGAPPPYASQDPVAGIPVNGTGVGSDDYMLRSAAITFSPPPASPHSRSPKKINSNVLLSPELPNYGNHTEEFQSPGPVSPDDIASPLSPPLPSPPSPHTQSYMMEHAGGQGNSTTPFKARDGSASTQGMWGCPVCSTENVSQWCEICGTDKPAESS